MEQNGSGDGGGTRVVMVEWRGRQWRNGGGGTPVLVMVWCCKDGRSVVV